MIYHRIRYGQRDMILSAVAIVQRLEKEDREDGKLHPKQNVDCTCKV